MSVKRIMNLCLNSISSFRIEMVNSNKIINIWKAADAVTFDVDSTVTREEGIDELANFCGKGEQIRELTKQAMQGDMTFQQSLLMRLQIINPSLTQVKEFLDIHEIKLTNGIKELVSDLQTRGKDVYLISGGFHCLILPVARKLNIKPENIYANKLKFYFTGEFAGFDENQPTSRSGGKAEVIQHLKETRGYKTIVHIGDGSTDLEASPPADAFIGFGGNVIRESVKSRSQWFVMNFDDLRRIL
ncbi:phosphoserine phosphatase isoform X2 [Camponotus floridanus]|uniref:phosphoserine phosphatase isoform X2 n=1 Tax=Camponotus floridanus TaxID=104421 RepID=UPI0009715DF6|nr:phosphoserine phosphatase isoform X2 [Camponotus floridanus]